MKIICVGRNYVEHIKELGNKTPDNPVIFFKTQDSLSFKNEIKHKIILKKANKNFSKGSLLLKGFSRIE